MDTVCVPVAAVRFALLRPLRDLCDELDAALLPGESALEAAARRDAARDLAAEGWLLAVEDLEDDDLEVAACSA